MLCVVLGATGHIGAAFCHYLVEQGFHVRAVARGVLGSPALQELDLERVAVDLDEAEFQHLFDNADYVVDASAPYPLDLSSPAELVHRGMARYRRLLNAIETSGSEYAYISSFVTLNRPESNGRRAIKQVTTRSHPYYIVKHRIEGLVSVAARKNSKVRIYCPSACIGPWDRRKVEHCIVPLLIQGKLPIVAQSSLNVIDVRDLAAAVTRDSLQSVNSGRRVAVYGRDLKVAEFVNAVSRVADCREPPVLPIPAVIANAGLLAVEIASTVSGYDLPVPALPVLLLNESYRTVGEEVLELPAKISLEQSIADAIQWYGYLGYV